MKNYLKLLSFLKDHKRLFSLAVVAMFVASFFEGIQLSLLVPLADRIFNNKPIIVPNQLPGALTRVIDHLNVMTPEELLRVLPFVALGMMIIKHIFTYLYQYLMNDVAQKILRDVRQKLYNTIQSLSLDYFSKKRTGELISRVAYDVQIIENAISYSVTDLFRQTFLIIVYVVVALSIHFQGTVVAFIVFPLIMWPIMKIGKKLRKLAKRLQERMADINSILIETITGIKVVKAFCTEEDEIERFRGKNQDFYKTRMKTVKRLLFLPPITEIAGVICGIIIILWLGQQVIDGALSVGIFILFLGSILLIISPIKKLGNVNAVTQQALAANERIYAVLDQEATIKEIPNPQTLPIISRNIKINHVTFRYDDESADVLKNINLEIRVGELVAIVGPTGVGKSTLVNLIPRFYDPVKGSVEIDDQDIRDVSFKSLRQQMSIVSQETFLFNDTVKANIAYGYKSASQEEIEDAAKKAYAHRFIITMPQKYDTVVGEKGFRLSGGEKQRMAIARAILRNPPILILDEATSQLDSESEKYVQEALDELMEGRTVIAIAHRLSTIKKADRIAVLDNGELVGVGPHEKLLKECALYKRLYETQFQT